MIAQIQRKHYECPVCKHVLIKRIPRGWLVKKLLFFIPLRRYHCENCQRKVYVNAHKL